jgi:hypothetical protein
MIGSAKQSISPIVIPDDAKRRSGMTEVAMMAQDLLTCYVAVGNLGLAQTNSRLAVLSDG